MASPHPPANPPHDAGARHLRPVHTATSNPTADQDGHPVREPARDAVREQHDSTGREHATDPAAGLVPMRRVVLTPAATVELKPTYWLWENRIPAGAITLGPGREGIGKSLFCAWLAAQITNGSLPGIARGQRRSVIYAATEDSWERTIAGRLLAAEADLNRVYRIEVAAVNGSPAPLSLPTDCAALAEQIPAHDVALLVLDPLISAIDSRINVNQEELREALEPLARLADDTGCAIFGLAHFNKASGTDALSRVTGSRAFAAVARAAIAFARDPNAEDGSCVISQVKSNLGRLDVPSLRYRVDTITLDTPHGPGQWGRLQMLGETDAHVESILNTEGRTDRDSDKPGSESSAAVAWLEDYLVSEGGSVAGADAKRTGQKAGFSQRTIERAHEELLQSQKVVDKSEGFPRRVFWTLP